MDVAKAATLPNAYVFEPKANWGDFARRVESLLSLRFTSVIAPPPTRDDARCPDVGVEKAIS